MAVAGGSKIGSKSIEVSRLDLFKAASHAGDPSVLGPLAEELELVRTVSKCWRLLKLPSARTITIFCDAKLCVAVIAGTECRCRI